MALLAQFPLQSVLLPGMPLRLRIFEPRYVALLNDVDPDDEGGRFGVVLITRGSEVGGDDQRADVGTVAQITAKRMVADGVWAVDAEGVERFRVIEWLPDDPYPKAVVEPWPATFGHDDAERLTALIGAYREFLGMAAELGADVSDLGEVASGMAGVYRMTETLPITAYDRFAILSAPTASKSIERLGDALAGVTELLRHELGDGDG